ncbi:DoxX-like family protein [Flavobacterium gillisiae]|uniref:DoxX-like family protein n=1 Tax=Flavobacterium gillisiae TaxID=150146 RepID=A0A1H4EJU9_9FLAO|nr:DoxX family protein [Flavobacterium gillisiae]SEA85321.1 DoxX-like family protein [Flavobacterium gillisiae]
MKSSLFSWLLRIVVAAILVQTLYFKFTGAAESIYIFKTLGMEPYGRIGSGIIELVASILILIPRTTLLGALLGLGVMFGAIVSHVFVLGIEVQNDGGTLFMLALITFLCCSILVYQNRNKMTDLLKLKI